MILFNRQLDLATKSLCCCLAIEQTTVVANGEISDPPLFELVRGVAENANGGAAGSFGRLQSGQRVLENHNVACAEPELLQRGVIDRGVRFRRLHLVAKRKRLRLLQEIEMLHLLFQDTLLAACGNRKRDLQLVHKIPNPGDQLYKTDESRKFSQHKLHYLTQLFFWLVRQLHSRSRGVVYMHTIHAC